MSNLRQVSDCLYHVKWISELLLMKMFCSWIGKKKNLQDLNMIPKVLIYISLVQDKYVIALLHWKHNMSYDTVFSILCYIYAMFVDNIHIQRGVEVKRRVKTVVCLFCSVTTDQELNMTLTAPYLSNWEKNLRFLYWCCTCMQALSRHGYILKCILTKWAFFSLTGTFKRATTSTASKHFNVHSNVYWFSLACYGTNNSSSRSLLCVSC